MAILEQQKKGLRMDKRKFTYNGKRQTNYRAVAERVLGKPLPVGCQIHHHTDTQFVICENQTYHALLHMRTRALKACGHASWRKCSFCKRYDKPENLFITKELASHRERKPRVNLSDTKIIRFMKMVLDK